MNVSLTPQLEELIAKKVETGLYGSASEVVREALRLLDEQDRLRALRLQDLRDEIALGIKDLDEGRSVIFNEDTVRDIETEGRKRLAEWRNRSAKA